MALSQATLDAITAAVAAAMSAAPALPAVASGHYKARDLPCTATPACTRKDLRTVKRAATHGVDAGGHTAR